MKSNVIYCLTTYNYQILSLIMFIIGLLGVILLKNFIKILISAEFIINGINILFISFSSYQPSDSYIGFTIVLFTTGISAVVLAIALYFLYILRKKRINTDTEELFNDNESMLNNNEELM